jgi:membrane associated rhomboid family serine protease
MNPFINELKQRYRAGDISLRLIYINVGVYLFFTLLNILWVLCQRQGLPLVQYFELPAWPLRWLQQPWSLVTYMFVHADVWHLLFNMCWLYIFGQLFLVSHSSRHFRGVYLLGGLVGGLAYMLAYNVFPYFRESAGYYGSGLVGASAAVLALVMATALRSPDYRLRFLLIGYVRLKYVALFVVLFDLLFITSDNAGGHIAHLGGALAGWAFAAGLNRGRDLTAGINWIWDTIEGLVHRPAPRKRAKMEGHFGGRAHDYSYNATRRQKSEEVDRILEKLKKSGYDSLSEEEKKSLFDASKR